jgi:hypothetical protein
MSADTGVVPRRAKPALVVVLGRLRLAIAKRQSQPLRHGIGEENDGVVAVASSPEIPYPFDDRRRDLGRAK